MEVCKICGAILNEETYFYEKMYGSNEQFIYSKCSQCFAYQIKDIPPNIGQYYKSSGDSAYYSLAYNSQTLKYRIRDKILSLAGALFSKSENILYKDKISSKIIYRISRHDNAFNVLREISAISKESAILDVGCGTGWLLYKMKILGFSNLLGIDAFLDPKNEISTDGIEIKRGDIFELNNRKFDLIMFHHSLEHMQEPLLSIKKARDLLNDEGAIVVRIPIISSFAFDTYGVNWVNFDAPRHLFNFSIESINYLAEAAQLQINKVIYDSEEFQFWGSELYKRGYTLSEENKARKYELLGIADKGRHWKLKARKLNLERQGDTVAIYLYKQSKKD